MRTEITDLGTHTEADREPLQTARPRTKPRPRTMYGARRLARVFSFIGGAALVYIVVLVAMFFRSEIVTF